MKNVTKAVIPAAGFGTRFLPVTKAVCKEMLPIVDKPTLQYIVEEAVAAGIKDILVITGRNKKILEDFLIIRRSWMLCWSKKGNRSSLKFRVKWRNW